MNGTWRPVVNRPEAHLLTAAGLIEERDFLVSPPLLQLAIQPSTAARMAEAARFASGGIIPDSPGEHGDGVPAILNGGCRP